MNACRKRSKFLYDFLYIDFGDDTESLALQGFSHPDHGVVIRIIDDAGDVDHSTMF